LEERLCRGGVVFAKVYVGGEPHGPVKRQTIQEWLLARARRLCWVRFDEIQSYQS